jgi:hypothetical protein
MLPPVEALDVNEGALVEMAGDDDDDDDDDSDGHGQQGKPLLEALAEDEAALLRRYRERKRGGLVVKVHGARGLSSSSSSWSAASSPSPSPSRLGAVLLAFVASAALAAAYVYYSSAVGSGAGGGGAERGAGRHHGYATEPREVLLMLRSKLDAGRREMELTLRQEYGPYYDAMFTRTVPSEESGGRRLRQSRNLEGSAEGGAIGNGNGNGTTAQQPKASVVVSVGRYIFQSPTLSDELGPGRLRQKMMRKLLEVVLSLTQTQTQRQPQPHGGGGATNGTTTTFVWATGGHSSSAGHGNLHNESYSATLERVGRAAFEAVGIGLEGRNHAMGATSSYPEVALCGEEVFGLDVDLLSWDYGMVRGRRMREIKLDWFCGAGTRSECDTHNETEERRERFVTRVNAVRCFSLGSILTLLSLLPAKDGRK